MSRIKDFRDLNVWNIGMDITVEIYQFTKDFPEYELYGITSQMRKAAVSIPSNIIEILQQLGRMLTSLIKCITENISFSPIKKSNRSSLLNQRPATENNQQVSK